MTSDATRSGVFDLFDAAAVEFGVFVILFALVVSGAYQRNLVWRDGISFWSDVSAKSPMKARPYNNLGDAFISAARYAEAIEALRRGVEADPWYIEPHFNLGIAYIKTRFIEGAVSEFTEVVRINRVLKSGHYGARVFPRFEFEALSNLGNLYNMMGEFDEALLNYTEALKLVPEDVSTHFNLAVAYKRNGMTDEARAEFREVLRLDPSDEGARRSLRVLGER